MKPDANGTAAPALSGLFDLPFPMPAEPEALAVLRGIKDALERQADATEALLAIARAQGGGSK